MTRNIKNFFTGWYTWYDTNLAKILFIVLIFIASYYIVNLPYINIFTSIFLFLPYLIAWLGILALFRPKKDRILRAGIMLFAINFIFSLFRLRYISEILGDISYFMIATYIFITIKDMRK